MKSKEVIKKKFIGFCPFCRSMLDEWNIHWKDDNKPLERQRVECTSCDHIFRRKKLKKRLPRDIHDKIFVRRRTIFPRPTYEHMVKEFIHYYNLYPLFCKEYFAKYEGELLQKGVDKREVWKAKKEASKKCNWTRNEFIADRVGIETGNEPEAMITKKRRGK